MADKKGNKRFNRNNNNDDDSMPRQRRVKKRVCAFCADKNLVIDYKEADKLKRYVSEKGKKLKLYTKYVGFVKQQLKALEKEGKTPRVRGVFWLQGESDSFLEYSYKYKDAEEWFFKYLRHDLNAYIYDHFNFVDAYIFTRGICWVNPEIINDCKQRFADEIEHCYCIKTNGEDENAIKLYLKCETGEGDDLAHYDSQSNILLGKTAVEYLIK